MPLLFNVNICHANCGYICVIDYGVGNINYILSSFTSNDSDFSHINWILIKIDMTNMCWLIEFESSTGQRLTALESAPDLLVQLFAEVECVSELCILQRVRARLEARAFTQ